MRAGGGSRERRRATPKLEAGRGLGAGGRGDRPYSRAGGRDGRAGADRAAARGRPLHGAGADRAARRCRQLLGSGTVDGRRRIRRRRQPARVHPRGLRDGAGRDRRATGGDRRRRFHDLGRQSARGAQERTAVHAAAGAPIRVALHPVGGGGGTQFEVGRGGGAHGVAFGGPVGGGGWSCCAQCRWRRGSWARWLGRPRPTR